MAYHHTGCLGRYAHCCRCAGGRARAVRIAPAHGAGNFLAHIYIPCHLGGCRDGAELQKKVGKTDAFSACHSLQYLGELTSGGSSGYLSEKLIASLQTDMLMLRHSTKPPLPAVCTRAAV